MKPARAVFILGCSLLCIPAIALAATFTSPLTLGNTGSQVTDLQHILISQGLLPSDDATGYYGPLTFAAVKSLQTSHHLDAVGSIGPLTRTLLNSLSASSTIPEGTSSTTTAAVTTPVTTASGSSSCTPLTITRPLDVGATGKDVTDLQTFLISQGLLPSDDATGYYGPLTAKAVSAFQTANHIDAIGAVGPLTRAKFASISSTCTSPHAATTSTTVTATSTLACNAASSSTCVPGTSITQPVSPGNGYSPGFGGGGGGGGGGSVSTPTPDTTAPTSPANLAASVVSSSQINLSWTAATDNVGVTGYKVYRDGTQIATPATNSYNDTGLANASLHSYSVTATDAAGNVSTSSATISAQSAYGTDQFGTTWKPLRVGAGGYITGIDIASDGTRVIRTDTHGAYLWDSTQWDQLVSTSSMPTSDVQINVSGGVYEIRIAPSNTNRFYMMFKGYVYRSDNRGVTWTKTAMTQFHDASNENYRTMSVRMAVDPANQNIVVIGTPDMGTWMTSDAGSTWTHLTALATSTKDGNSQYEGELIAYDPTSSVVSGATQGMYVAVYGTGIYHSTDGGATWTLLNSSGMPTTFQNMIVAQDGTLYVTAGSSASLYVYSSGAWSTVNTGTGGNGAYAVAVDPTNANTIVIVNAGGDLSISTNHAATFSGVTNSTKRTATDIPWLAWTNENYMSASEIEFDPTQTNKLYFSEGIGVWYTTPTSTETSINWTSQSTGIEQLVANEVVSPPGGYPLVASWDRPVFTITNPDQYPSTHGPNRINAIVDGTSLDWASNDPSYIVLDAGGQSSYSTDGGLTWSGFASLPNGGSLNPGSIAAASSTDIVWVPSNTQPYYSTNGGQTWTQITAATSSGFAYYLDREIVAADRVNIGTFYMYVNNNLFRSTDGGATWTLVHTEITPFDWYNSKLRTVPGVAGELFYTGGQQSPDSLGSPANEQFMKSTDGGSTWTAVPNVLDVYDFGFGKAAPGTTTPAIYMVGFVNSQYGIWESDDGANTWTQVGLFPFNHLDSIKTISGDMNAYGRVYVGFGGSGYAYGITTNAQIPPLITSISSGAPTTTSATITWATDQSSNSKIAYGLTSAYGSTTSSVSLTTSHSVTLTSLAVGTTYHYAVVSANSLGYTSTSTDHTFTTYNTNPPSVPTGLTATATSSSEVDLSWSASTGDGTYSVAGYNIYRDGTKVGTTSGTTYQDTGLAAYTAYTYTVSAYDTVGNVSAQSSSANSTTQWGVTFTPTAAPAIQWLGFGGGTTTFSGVSIGAATSSRIVVIGVLNDAAGGCCTDGGTSAVSIFTNGATTSAAEAVMSNGTSTSDSTLWYAQVTASTTIADIMVYPGASAAGNVGIMVGTITGSSAIDPVSTSTHPLTGAYIGDPQYIPTSGTMTVPKNGATVIFGMGGNAGTSAIWTNTTSPSGDYLNVGASGNGVNEVMAHSYAAGTQSFGVSSATTNGFAYGFSAVAASWGP